MQRLTPGFFPPIALAAEGGPIQRQLRDWFRRAIAEGRLRPGQRVPSTRGMARELSVSRAPVLAAYDQLHAEGYLETFRGAGTCVAGAIPQPSRPAPRAPSAGAGRRTSRLAGRLMAVDDGPPFRDLGTFRTNLPALDHFPTRAWASLVARHARRPDAARLAYSDPVGLLSFREAIADYLGASRAVRCDASQVMVVSGSQQGLQIAVRALLDPGDAVWLEEPGYPGARRALLMGGCEAVPAPVDAEGLDLEAALRETPHVRAAYLTPSHQFPLGVTMSAARRMRLLAWAAANGGWILEDDYDSEYRFGRDPVPSLQGLDADGRVIYLGTFSKVLFPALRVGYLVIPADLVPAFRAVREACDLFPPPLLQAALADFIREGHFARHLRRMRQLYMVRCEALASAVRTELSGALEVVSAEAGMHLVGLLPPGLDDREVCRAGAGLGLSLTPLSSCFLTPPSRGGLILGYGGAEPEEIREGVRRLGRVIADLAA